MVDIFSTQKRSEIMSKVRSTGNRSTEVAMILLLRRHRIAGWRRRFPAFGNPDFVFPKNRLAVFVDGCFWHGCSMHGTQPSSNVSFWTAKLNGNKARDRLVTRKLKRRGWHVLRIWQHEISRKNEEQLVRRIQQALEVARRQNSRSRPQF
jgi:DNA mismatch endonuclease (patch repair protein)